MNKAEEQINKYPTGSDTESPIEDRFLLSLLIICKRHNIKLLEDHNGVGPIVILENIDEKGLELRIYKQRKVGQYRIDFLLEYRITEPYIHNSLLIVECDGHKFHEKTKQQAKKDKKRDRVLQSQGYVVFHFTGSEIFKKPLECAHQCINYLVNQIYKESLNGTPPNDF